MKKIISISIAALLCLTVFPFSAQAAVNIPVIVVESFKTDASPVQPGEAFTLEIKLKNEGKKDAENISITLGEAKTAASSDSSADSAKEQTDGTKFLPVESGNVIYVNKIKKGEEYTANIKLASKSDTAPGLYMMDVALKYYNSMMSYENTAKIGLTLEQKESLVLKGLTYPQKIMLGEKAVITGEMVNISNSSIKAVTADYTGTCLEKQSEFFGAFKANDSATLENTFTPDKAGNSEIGIIISYYDALGKKQEIKNTVSIVTEEIKKSQAAQNNESGSGFLDFIKFLFGLGG